MIEVISNVNLDKKERKIDLEKSENFAIDEIVFDGKVQKIEYENTSVTLTYFMPLAVGSSSHGFVYCTLNGNTYAKIGDVFQLVTIIDVTKKPVISSIKVGQNRYPLIFCGDDTALYLDGDKVYRFANVCCEHVCDNGEMLFVSCDKTVTFSAVNDMTDFTFAVDRAGQINVDDSYGRIVGLSTESRNLIIFTEKSIFEFSPVGLRTDYTLKRLETPVLNVLEGSVKDVGDRIAFVSDGKLYYYKQGKIYTANSKLHTLKFKGAGNAVGDGSVYYLPVKCDGDSFYRLFRFDFSIDKECLVRAYSSLIFDGAFSVGNGDYLYKIKAVDAGVKSTYDLCELNQEKNRKTLVKIVAYVSGAGNVVLRGDSGKKELTFKDGLNEKRINLLSTNFSMEVSGLTSDFKIHEMRVKYITKGD